MEKVKVAIVGCGEIGRLHAKYLADGECEHIECAAVCDVSQSNLEKMKEILGSDIPTFTDYKQLLESGLMDGVLIATPHRFHCAMAIEAFKRGYHVLVEKPAGVYTKEVDAMNEAAKESGRVFGIMFMERTRPIYQKVKNLVESGRLGELKRSIWIATEWYRSQSYYDMAQWRGTWKGEGGGVLLNQSPHNLDLWQWICGMPVKIRANCSFGKYHDIEVEDDATIFAEYGNGASGIFITSTGEYPGTNRIEITGTKGKIIAEDNKITFWELDESERTFNEKNEDPFAVPVKNKKEYLFEAQAPLHKGITENWAASILGEQELLAKGEEGIKSLEISNAACLSAWENAEINLPIDKNKYFERFKENAGINS